jgi:hypothetical protein
LLRDVSAGGDLRSVHYGEERRSRGCHLSGIERTVCDHAIDGASDFRIAKLRRRAVVLALRRLKLPLGRLESLLPSDRLQVLQVPFRNFVLIAGVSQVHSSLIEFLAWHCALREQVLPAVVNFLRGVELLLGGVFVELSLLHFLRKIGGGGLSVSGLGLIVRTLIFLRDRREITVLEHCQQLSGVDAASAIHQKLLHGRADLRYQRRLRKRKKYGVRGDSLLQRRLFYGDDLDGNGRLGLFISS